MGMKVKLIRNDREATTEWSEDVSVVGAAGFLDSLSREYQEVSRLVGGVVKSTFRKVPSGAFKLTLWTKDGRKVSVSIKDSNAHSFLLTSTNWWREESLRKILALGLLLFEEVVSNKLTSWVTQSKLDPDPGPDDDKD